MKRSIIYYFLSLVCITGFAQNKSIPHLEKQGTATQLIVNGKPFLLLAGELHNSSTSSAAYMHAIWKQMAQKNLNTVIAGVSWELVEPEKGKFDFSLVDSMVMGARKQGLHLVLIWFGSWKNSASTYVPGWVKHNYETYPYVKDKSGKTLEVLSTFGDVTAQADAMAFGKLMTHVKETDSKQQTVIMVQVENEVGVLRSDRDYSDAANKAYAENIPADLSAYLTKNKNKYNLTPELYNAWKENGFKTTGSWEDVFGKNTVEDKDWKYLSYYTDELFMAYHYAKYIGSIAAEGKKAYDIPMYVNAWIKQPSTPYPGKYPSGGPQPEVMDMYRCAAPAIDMIVPDIYMPYFTWTCEQYHRLGNPLFIPETRGGELGSARAFYAFGEYDAMCFSPFGIDGDYLKDDALKAAYSTLGQLKELILKNQGKQHMKGVLVDTANEVQQITFGGYKMEAKLNDKSKNQVAGGIIISIAPDEFIIAGKGFDVFFAPEVAGNLPLVAIDKVDEGTYKNGQWIPGRRLNGDEVQTSTFSATGLRLPTGTYSIQHVKLYRFK